MTTESWTVTLPALPLKELSPNHYLGLGVWDRAREREVQRDIWLALLSQAGAFHTNTPLFTRPVDITIKLSGTGRRTDPSNWSASWGLKILLDCLTQPKAHKIYGLGMLVDDSFRYVHSFTVIIEPDGDQETAIRIDEPRVTA